VRRELPVEDAQLLYQSIHAFRIWDDAHIQLIVAEAHQHRRQDPRRRLPHLLNALSSKSRFPIVDLAREDKVSSW